MPFLNLLLMAILESDIRGNVLATDTRCILAFVIVLELAKKTEPTVQEKESIVCTRCMRVGAMASRVYRIFIWQAS